MQPSATFAPSGVSFPAPGDAHAVERGTALTPRFDAAGLVAAIAQHADTGEVLMLAWMNAAALERTLATGEAHYWSRSRAELWHKGATSGQVQRVTEVRIDCDQDAVLLRVRPQGDGGACHVGFRSCFYRVVEDGALVERDEPSPPLRSQPSEGAGGIEDLPPPRVAYGAAAPPPLRREGE